MGVTAFLARVARHAEIRVFCVAGAGSEDQLRSLYLHENVHISATPRGANILLLAGDIDAGLIAPALVAHDALAAPRATVWWLLGGQASNSLVRENFPDAISVADEDGAEVLRHVQLELLDGTRASEGPLLPDIEPAEWRGIGPYGQGGKAMTGGVPYGRAMAERAENRDGLKLDQLPVRVGPLFAGWPSGLALDLKLQGDVVQAVTVENFATGTPRDPIFHEALKRPVPIAEIELARARSHLVWLSRAAAVSGSRASAERILRLATRLSAEDADSLDQLERSLRRRGYLTWNTRGVGILGPDEVGEVTGPVARASGSTRDERAEDPAYTRLDFETVTDDGGDCASRWVQRLREARRSLEIAARAGDSVCGGNGRIESPRGLLTRDRSPSPALMALIPRLVGGMEWGDAVTSIVSLDFDTREARAVEGANVS